MRWSRATLVVVLSAFAAACSLQNVGCGVPETLAPPADATATTPTGNAAPADPSRKPTTTFTISFLGDSLTAGLGLLSQQAFPALVEAMFSAEGYTVETINGGISGDTSAGGLRRVDQFLRPEVKVLVLALGANDALRGLTVAQTRENLTAIIRAAHARNVAVVLCGMEAPTNYGEDYRSSFREVFARIVLDFNNKITFVPFLLEGVAAKPELNQADGVHPNEAGARVIAEMIYPRLRTVVDSLGGGG
jgi:acyl-CoA thioesterase I